MHPTTTTTSWSSRRHSHDICGPSGNTLVNVSWSSADGFAKPSAGESSELIASRLFSRKLRVSRRAWNAPLGRDAGRVVSVGNDESCSESIPSGSLGSESSSSVVAVSEIVSSVSATLLVAKDDKTGRRAVGCESLDSASRATARLSRKMPRGSSVTGWKKRRKGVLSVLFSRERTSCCFGDVRVASRRRPVDRDVPASRTRTCLTGWRASSPGSLVLCPRA